MPKRESDHRVPASVSLSPDERARFTAAAREAGVSLSEWLRRLGRAAVESPCPTCRGSGKCPACGGAGVKEG